MFWFDNDGEELNHHSSSLFGCSFHFATIWVIDWRCPYLEPLKNPYQTRPRWWWKKLINSRSTITVLATSKTTRWWLCTPLLVYYVVKIRGSRSLMYSRNRKTTYWPATGFLQRHRSSSLGGNVTMAFLTILDDRLHQMHIRRVVFVLVPSSSISLSLFFWSNPARLEAHWKRIIKEELNWIFLRYRMSPPGLSIACCRRRGNWWLREMRDADLRRVLYGPSPNTGDNERRQRTANNITASQSSHPRREKHQNFAVMLNELLWRDDSLHVTLIGFVFFLHTRTCLANNPLYKRIAVHKNNDEDGTFWFLYSFAQFFDWSHARSPF